jgi:hypothetical protein
LGIFFARFLRELMIYCSSIPLGGALIRQPWAIGGQFYLLYSQQMLLTQKKIIFLVLLGSGSTYIWGWCDANYKEGMTREEYVVF